jgi:hypothetical protein
LQAKNDPPPVGQAWFDRHAHCPAFARQGQFLLDPFAFRKQADGVGCEERPSEIEQPVERRAGARGHDIDRVRGHRLYPTWPYRHIGFGDARGFAQKGASPGIRFDQLDIRDAQNGQNEAREAGAAAEIGQIARRVVDQGPKLRRIEDVPAPQIGEGVAADEVDARRPPDQQVCISFETAECFT